MRNYVNGNKWLVGFLIFCLSGFSYSLNKSTWHVEKVGPGVRYTASGKLISGQQFGFAKLYNHCDDDMIWVVLSSKDKAITKIKGSKVEFMMRVDDVTNYGPMQLDVVEITPDPNAPEYIAILFASKANSTISNFVKILEKGKNIAVQLTSPADVAGMLQKKGADGFDLTGLSAARTKAYNLCKKH